LGLHAYKSHGLTARQYREDHGLKFSQGLVVAATRERMARNCRRRSKTEHLRRLKSEHL